MFYLKQAKPTTVEVLEGLDKVSHCLSPTICHYCELH